MFKRAVICIVLILVFTMISGCSNLGIKIDSTPVVSTPTVLTATPTLTSTPVVSTPTVLTATPTLTSTLTATEIPPTATLIQQKAIYNYNLFDKTNGLCFVVNAQPVRGMYRVLEFLYGLRIKGNSLVEYAPAERGNDKGTWPSWVLLVNGKTNRQTTCGEVEARHPILYRIAPVDQDLDIQWEFAMDNVDNPAYFDAYKASSVKTNHLGLFIGSEKGVDVDIQIFDETGRRIDFQQHHIAGAYCSDCKPGTSIVGNKAQYALTPEAFQFQDSIRKVLTTDVLAMILPKDFNGRYVITLHATKGTLTELWFGELLPLLVEPTPTATVTP